MTCRKTIRRLIPRAGALALAMFGLTACVTNGATTAYEGIGFREARFNEISAMRTYRACRDEAVALDELARADGSRGPCVRTVRADRIRAFRRAEIGD